MPFGCLALRDGRTYHSLSDVTDKYEIGQVLKAKEFCELCLAKERQTDKVYVCKKFLKKDGRKVRKAAKNEIMILKMVKHPNVLQLIDAFETRKEFFIIQELATGGDVFDWILDQGNYTERDASNVIRQVLEAVAYLHSLNIVHRNLKLENLMYYNENNHNKVVLRDFYLSRFENGSITEPCGTPEYLAPEVVARHRYGRPVDCWAVGVIMYILLSGNPPFYDETEEENTDLHNRIIFCRIVAGEFEFDSPYWDDISPAAKELVCRLMEVDQMLRITAQDALWHEWIAGNGASEKNLKDGVCAQFEKNFAKAKWRKAIRVTTFMQRLRASDMGASDGAVEAQASVDTGEVVGGSSSQTETEGVSTASVSHEVTVENRPMENQDRERSGEGEGERAETTQVNSTVRVPPITTTESVMQLNTPPTTPGDEVDGKGVKKGAEEDSCKVADSIERDKAPLEVSQTSSPSDPTSSGTKAVTPDSDASAFSYTDKKATSSLETPNRRKMAANLTMDHGMGPGAKTSTPPAEAEQPVQSGEKGEAAKKQEMSPSSWCQTQLPEAVAERPVLGVAQRDVSPRGREGEEGRADKSVQLGTPSLGQYRGLGSQTPGCPKPFTQEDRDHGVPSFGSSYCSPYSVSGGVMYRGLEPEVGACADWQMDSVIEQIEKQMAAVLEKIEGDMPSLLEQISDCPETLPRAKSAQSSPSTRPPSYHHSTPPPLPTSQRPPVPSLPHLTIPPPSYPPPSPPTHSQPVPGREERDEHRGSVRSFQSPRGGVSGRGL